MPALLTEVTEIVTGLGMLGQSTLEEALERLPEELLNVSDETWQGLRDTYRAGEHLGAFTAAWENGRAFLEADDGLRGRIPQRIEWKGPHRQPGYDNLPVDLRVDHVFLVSCKYQSKILSNSSPANLFDRLLGRRETEPVGPSWYQVVSPHSYSSFYSLVRGYIGEDLLPSDPADLSPEHLQRIRKSCNRAWPEPLREPWAQLSFDISAESARRWESAMDSPAKREEMLWRLLRLGPAPYFVLGSSPRGPVRMRIGTPWDWRQSFKLRYLRVAPVVGGQPVVEWVAGLTEVETGRTRRVHGHIEIRWAHGRFSTVEAKVYLDTPHVAVAGYYPLDIDSESDAGDQIAEYMERRGLFDEFQIDDGDPPIAEQRTLWTEL